MAQTSGVKLLDSQWRAKYMANRMREFVQRCHERGLSITPQRLAVIKALLSCENHPSAEEVFVQVRKQLPHISLATVHRILEQFCEVGEARKVTPLHATARYDGHVEPHHHIVCISCRSVRDIEIPGADVVIKNLPNLGEFTVVGGALEIYAVCGNCRRKNSISVESNGSEKQLAFHDIAGEQTNAHARNSRGSKRKKHIRKEVQHV